MPKQKRGVKAALDKLSAANARAKETRDTLRRSERMQGEEERSERSMTRRPKDKMTAYKKGGSVRGMGAATRGGKFRGGC